MIQGDKVAFLMQLILSSKEELVVLEQALRVSDAKRVEEVKRELISLNRAIRKALTELKISKG
ncbi:MAG: hypothetical protein K6T16_01335 [Candidatus Pacearchaeota archaeon]|nr:hypothetical protein [Candidatus Pacearchaeota archaeon]